MKLKYVYVFLVLSGINIQAIGSESLKIHAPHKESFSCTEHWDGQFKSLGDALGTDCVIQELVDIEDRVFQRLFNNKGYENDDWFGFEKDVLAPCDCVVEAININKITNKPGIISFDGGYHGLGYGALLGSGFDKFKKPFEAQLAGISYQLTFPTNEQELEEMCSQLGQINSADVGAILVEPIQGRGGKKVPPEGFLKALREWSDNEDVVLIFDEIYSGLNRSGKLFACEWEGVFPDLLCVGKALSGGYPISACIGKSEVMDKWPVSTGEALHTSTFLGNPVGCAMANVALDLHRDPALADDVLKQGEELMVMLRELDSPWISEIRGRGLMIGMELRNPTTGSPAGAEVGAMLGDLLKQGIIMLADGPEGNVLAFTPPFHLKLGEMVFLVAAIKKELSKLN